ncbi:M48 family metalloprotease [Zavarzinia compransoris]|uniref:Peptidase n=1 Tax=Zavarzinia compransoris TaxID=1264899 RepID=A0A317EEF0_9PROT|nr:M48 family metalloprotease [Zavarzinia compransoris]PWR23733.1 peptidase [Zavarzinia compransoris]TDP47958.1 putative Zn-dependent protease [Zavarzinia compransoris]
MSSPAILWRLLRRRASGKRIGAFFMALVLALGPLGALSPLGPSILGASLLGASQAQAQSGPRALTLIRDAEIENYIRAMATPIFEAAGLDASAVRVILIQDPSLNAFVAGGQNLFLNTGTLAAVSTPEQLMGVIAHETGHIAGGHLVRSTEALRNASIQQIIATVLGAIAIIGGGGDAGAAVMMGGAQVAQRSFLQYSRTQESAADQAAITFLDRLHVTSRGLGEFLSIIERDNLRIRSDTNPYIYTHPIGADRLSALETRVNQSPYVDAAASPVYVEMLARIQGKLRGYTNAAETVIRQIPSTATGLADRYARVVALYRKPDLPTFLIEIDRLLQSYPNDPFFLELKGQGLLENGRVAEAVEPYRLAVKYAPKEPLIRVGLASAMVATEDPKQAAEAIKDLEIATREDPDNSMAWYQLAIAYGRQGDIGKAALASAERFLLTGKMEEAYQQAQRAEANLPVGSPGALRAADIRDLSLRLWRERR